MRRFVRRAWRAALVAAALALVVAIVVDRWYAAHLHVEARAHTRVAMTPYVTALAGAVERRIALLAGVRSFADSRRTRRALDEEFPLFAQGTLVGTSGVVALQFVEGGRVSTTWPIVGNEPVLGYDLYADPRPEVPADVRRAMSSGEVTVTGPIALVQGGEGLLVRHRVTPRPGFPDLAAIILDVPTLIAEAGIDGSAPDVQLEVRDRTMTWFGGDPVGSVVAAETLSVRVPDGDWSLLGMPREGWDEAIAADLRSSRTTSAALVLAAALLGLVLGGREERLVREVAESGTRLGLALRAGQMGAWEYEVAGDRIAWSEAAAAMFGYAPDELDGHPRQLFERVHPDDRPTLQRTIDEMRRGMREEYVAEYRVLHADGTVRWVLGMGELECDATGRPLRMLGVVSDDSERRVIEERLRHSQRLEAVGTLAGGVAHDFNNLLTAIIGFAELAADRTKDLGEDPRAAAIREDLAQVLMTAERAAALTAQLLAFSRRKDAEPTQVDVSAALRELEPMLRRLVGSDHTYLSEIRDGLPTVFCDAGQLTQVMLNLVVNARDAMPTGGTIVVRARVAHGSGSAAELGVPPGTWVCIEVQDSGVGMTAEVQARIFEPYFTTKQLGRGTGLGLAVVYGAVENAGGEVRVESAAGVGTTFRVYLPYGTDRT